MLKPLTPQSPRRVAWEDRVTCYLCETLRCSRGDAQGLIEAQGDLIDECYRKGMSYKRAALAIDKASTVEGSGEGHDLPALQVSVDFAAGFIEFGPADEPEDEELVQSLRDRIAALERANVHLVAAIGEAREARDVAGNRNDELAGREHELRRDLDGAVRGLNECRAHRDALATALRDLIRTFTDGSHYETRNPYTRPPVIAGLKALAAHRGMHADQWMDAARAEGL